jgi:hypothetical protein
MLLLLSGCDRFAVGEKADNTDHLDPRHKQIADFQTGIDLAIAQDDYQTIEGVQDEIDRLKEAIKSSNKNHGPEAEFRDMVKHLTDNEAELDKAIDRAARHRCNR